MNFRSMAPRLAGLGAAAVLAAGIGLAPTAFASGYSIVGSKLPNPTFNCSGNLQTGFDTSGTGGTFSGTVIIAGNYTGTVTMELRENPQQKTIPLDGHTTTTLVNLVYDSSTDQTTGQYTFSDVGSNGGNGSYIGTISSANPAIAGSSAKTNSVQCTGAPTAATYSNIGIHTAGGKHVVTWYATRPVLGFNVFSGHTKLNHSLITSRTAHYSFSTAHSIAHLTLKPVNR